ncbi:MAG: sugar ABC transporter substrate-binding protein, partial [Propionivibrio sp.]|nr:sugar ABC transporter substrate-binding protein [Propionivibrio sp.]
RLHDADSLIAATVTQLPDVLAQKAVETGYAMMRKKPVASTFVLIPPELLTRESPPESTEWGQ